MLVLSLVFSLFGQSFEYFALRAKLLEGLSQAAQEELTQLDFDVARHLETECDWLDTFLSSVSQRYDLLRLPSRTDMMPDLRSEAIPEKPLVFVAEPSGPFESLDECVLSGHLLLMHSLLTCEGVDKTLVGESMSVMMFASVSHRSALYTHYSTSCIYIYVYIYVRAPAEH